MEDRGAISLPRLIALYNAYAVDLRSVRDQQRAIYDRWPEGTVDRGTWPSALDAVERERARPRSWLREWFAYVMSYYWRGRRSQKVGLYPQFDDIEAEVTYLLLRDRRPETVVEFSPGGGWSTTWILSALRDNGRGTLHSFDLIEHARHIVPPELGEGRWVFTKGDVRRVSFPSRIDHLFVDSAHTAPFARWYLRDLLPKVAPGAVVSVDDIYRLPPAFGYGEAKVVLRWLDAHRIPAFTASPFRAPDAFRAILETKRQLGLDPLIHSSCLNPAVFFTYRPDDRAGGPGAS